MEGLEQLDSNKIETNDREFIFDSLILSDISEAFISDLEKAGFEKEEVDEFLDVIGKYDKESIKGIFAMPKELRNRNFEKYKKDIDAGKTTIIELAKSLREIVLKYGYTLGYHISKFEIRPDSHDGSWKIKGTELDDRDNRLMAYYSLDYANLFRKKRGPYLYAVRAKIGEGTEHKRDTSNNWGRADSLSIVHQIYLPEIDKRIEDKIEEINKKTGGAD